MGNIYHAPGVLLSELDGDFDCPICTCPNTYEDYGRKFEKSKDPVARIKCKGCKRTLFATFNLHGDIVVWEP